MHHRARNTNFNVKPTGAAEKLGSQENAHDHNRYCGLRKCCQAHRVYRENEVKVPRLECNVTEHGITDREQFVIANFNGRQIAPSHDFAIEKRVE